MSQTPWQCPPGWIDPIDGQALITEAAYKQHLAMLTTLCHQEKEFGPEIVREDLEHGFITAADFASITGGDL